MQFLFQNIKTEQKGEEIETKENMFCREIIAAASPVAKVGWR